MDASDAKRILEQHTWEEESGLIDFLSRVHREVTRFDNTLGFGIEYMAAPPAGIDGKKENLAHVGFVVIRRNNIIPERCYCLYSLLKERMLCGFIGIYDNEEIETVKDLKPIENFRSGSQVLYEWLRELVKASCDKL